MSGGEVKSDPFRFRWEWTLLKTQLSAPRTFAVGMALAIYSNIDGTSVRPGVQRLAAGTGLGRRSVDRALQELRELGLIQRVRSGGWQSGLADEYRLTIPPSATTTHDDTVRHGGATPDTTNSSTLHLSSGATKHPCLTEDELAELVKIAPGFDDDDVPEVKVTSQKPGPVESIERVPESLTAGLSFGEVQAMKRSLARTAAEEGFDPTTGEYGTPRRPRNRKGRYFE